jgi:hypothetical protein
VINLPSTAVALGIAAMSGGTNCSMYKELMVVCKGSRWAPAGKSGFTLGNVYLQHDQGPINPVAMQHETNHATQNFFLGGNPLSYGALYFTAMGTSWIDYKIFGPVHDGNGEVCTTSIACYNPFEQTAGLHKGGYFHP